MVSLERRHEMPASAEEIAGAEEEGIRLVPGRGPKAVLGRGGKVVGLETLDVTSVFDADGRFNPTLAPGSERQIECDTVILSIGQTPDLSSLAGDPDIETTARGLVKVDAKTLATTSPGVFCGGDLAFGRGSSSRRRRMASGPPWPSTGSWAADVSTVRRCASAGCRCGAGRSATIGSPAAGPLPSGPAALRLPRDRGGLFRDPGQAGGRALPLVQREPDLRLREVPPLWRLRRRLPGELPEDRVAGSTFRRRGAAPGAARRAGRQRERRGPPEGRRTLHPLRPLRGPLSHRGRQHGAARGGRLPDRLAAALREEMEEQA